MRKTSLTVLPFTGGRKQSQSPFIIKDDEHFSESVRSAFILQAAVPRKVGYGHR